MVSSAVTFCVGGSFFTTLHETLAKEPSCRISMMARGTLPCSRDSQGVIFIDRDPKHFQTILNFIRDGWALLPSLPDERTELVNELRHFQLASMETWIRSQDLVHARTPPSSPFPSSLANRLDTSLALASSSPSQNPYSPGFSTRGAGGGGAQPTVAYTGMSPSRRSLFPPGVQPVIASGLIPGGPQSRARGGFMSTPQAKSLAAAGASSSQAVPGGDLRSTFIQATMASPAPSPAPSYALPPPPGALTTSVMDPYYHSLPSPDSSVGKWTAKYLKTHEGLREVANTIMELAYLHPHPSLHAGKVEVRVSCECRHGKPSSLLSHSTGIHASPASHHMVVSVKSASGWSFNLDLKPGSCDPDLARKYYIGEVVQENWFVLCAVLKDQFGVLMEEQGGERPSCLACKRINLTITLNKIF